jgi:hypothetical protein
MEPQIVAQTTTNKMADPSELELSTPQNVHAFMLRGR